jgi:hypothetical protein
VQGARQLSFVRLRCQPERLNTKLPSLISKLGQVIFFADSRKQEIPKKWWNSEQKKRFANQPIGVRHPPFMRKKEFFFK